MRSRQISIQNQQYVNATKQTVLESRGEKKSIAYHLILIVEHLLTFWLINDDDLRKWEQPPNEREDVKWLDPRF